MGFRSFMADYKAGMTRRELQKALGAVGLGLVTMPITARAQDETAEAPAYPQDDELTVFEWAGYELPDFHKAYIDKYGKTPTFTFFGEEEEALQKMRSGFRADVSHPCTYSTARWRDAGLLKPIDTSRIDHWSGIFPNLLTLRGNQDAEGRDYFVPWDWGNSSVIYRTDLVDPAYLQEESWNILFDERYKGRLATYDSVDGVLAVTGLAAGVKDIFNPDDAETEVMREMLAKQRDLLRFYWTDQTLVEQGIASGELVASYAWNSALVNLKKQGVPVAYMKPKEGILTWVCGLVAIEGGPGKDEKLYDYLSALLAPDAGAYLINEYGYGHSNRESFKLVPPERLADLGISDAESHMAGGVFFDEIAPDVREKWINIFEEVKAGY